ncbi:MULTISPECIES: TerD family protein [unclassified Modicisalibacter]|uniref:TerD family protein n=1 Tax=unclassified Modicisalibacter TaxID=2679913 RepID=UPI001CCE866A|nr:MULTISPECIES: TerD family protein [unclassified Modicisalibacter]MBZ9559131.1 TerD family protein [Modicisalibacter sp. R2A 31.J]MBZ9576704.1 TerD family protein [Modicisalibacter sp. MOD 31.J]
MAISLSKGGNISLSKEAPGIKKIRIGLGWDARVTTGQDFDLDASVFLTNSEGKCRQDQDFIFYNNLKSTDGSVEHMGDNRTGAGDGDDEVIKVDLEKVPSDVDKIAVTVTIHDAQSRGQNFGQVENAFARVINDESDQEIVRYDLSEDYSVEDAMIFCEVYRNNGEWKFRAIGQGFSGGLADLASKYGLNAS